MTTKSNSGAPTSSAPKKAQIVLLIVAIVLALAVAGRFASGLFRDVTAEHQQFGPSPEALRQMKAEYEQTKHAKEADKKTAPSGDTR